MNSSASAGETRPPLSPGRRRLFGLVLLLIVVLVPLALVEAGLRLAGYGYETDFLLERTVNGRRVFVDNPKFAHRFFPPRVARSPQTLMVDAEKPAGVTRVVVLGESAALGDPEPAFGLARQLGVLLNLRFPGRKFEVINVAMTAINSHAFPDIARSAAKLGADYWIIYAGNNEFMGPFGPASVGGAAGRSRVLIRIGLALQRTRTGQWLAQLAGRFGGESTAGDTEFAGLETFLSQRISPDDPRLAAVYENFRANLSAVLDQAHATGVTTVLAAPAVNLRDSAPFASAPTPNEPAIQQLLTVLTTNLSPELVRELEVSTAANSNHATLRFYHARSRVLQRDTNGARADFVLARDLDALKFRADSNLIAVTRELARARAGENVLLLDAETLIAPNAPLGLPGTETFWEHVHFNFDGNFRLASLVADTLAPKLGGGTGAAVTRDTVAAELAFTEWDRYRVTEMIGARLQRPPFTDRINASEQQSVITTELLRLRPQTAVTAFERHAPVYRAALAKRTNDWLLRDHYARLLAAFGDRDSAIEEWRQVVAAVPHHLLAHYQLGDLLSASTSTATAAESHLRAALALREDFPEAWDRLGQALGQQQKFPEAEAAFVHALELRPNFTQARVNRAMSQVGAGRTNEALATLRDATTRDTNNAAAWQNLSRLCAATGDAVGAAEAADAVAQLRPQLAAAQSQAAEAWQRANRPERAAPRWLATLKLNPDNVQARYFLALKLASEKQFAQAAEQFREVTRRQPDLATAHLNLGVALMQLQRPEEALGPFERAAELDPSDQKAKSYVKSVRELIQGRAAGPR